MPPASASPSSAARSSASRPSRATPSSAITRPSAAPERIAPSRFWRSGTACQPTMISSSTACADALGGERRDRANERLGRAPGVEHLALADRAGADRGAQVVVAADREHRAARRRQHVADRAERRPRGGRLGQQPRRRARPGERLVPPAARVQVEPARARRERELGALLAAEAVHDPFADAQPAHAARGLLDVVAQPAVLGDRAQRARRQPGRGAEALGRCRPPAAPPPPRRASRARRSAASPARRGGRAARRSRPCSTRRGPRPGSPARRRAPRGRPRARSRGSRRDAISAPVGTAIQLQRRLAVRDLLALGGHDGGLARRRPEVEPQEHLRGHRAAS